MAVKQTDFLNNLSIKSQELSKPLINNSKEVKVSVDVKSNTAKLELLKRLGITEEQLNVILNKYPDFYSLAPEKQLTIAAGINTLQPEKETPKNQVKDSVSSSEPSNLTKENKDVKISAFDNKAFAVASNADKTKIYAEELAKNKFMYADSRNVKNAENWQALSEDKKQELIKNELQALEAKKDQKADSDIQQEKLSRMLQIGMTELQAANMQEISVEKMNKRGLAYKEQIVHDYVFDLPEAEQSDEQKKYLEIQAHKSELLCDYAKKQGVELSATMSPSDLRAQAKKLGVKVEALEIKELEEKQAREGKNFSSEDKTKLRNLRNVIAFSDVVEKIEEKQKNGKYEKSGLLESFSDSDFGKEFFALDSSDGAKCKAVYGYVHTLPKDQKTPDKLANLFNELREKDPELAVKVQQYVLGNSSIAEQSEFVKSDNKLAQAVVSSSINAIHTSVAIEKARKDKAMQAEDPETAEALAVLRINSSDEDHLLATSKIDASFGNVNVEKAHVDVAHNKDVVSAKAQLEMLNDTFDLGGIEAQKYAGVTNDQSYKENQLPLHNKAIQNKEVNDAMVEAGTYSRYASENQVSALTAHKQRYEQDDYTEKEAIAGLNKLSDYIADCSKDNQLAMHNEMMTSKYSEVQEHTARNIKNYDLTVQADALSTVYKSGNEKAIAVAVNEVLPAIKSPDAQQITLKQAVMELAGIVDTSELQAKFANGALTKAEIAQLSPTERREYYTRLFDNASPAEKIKYLKSIPSGKNKATIYSLIGKYYPTLFKDLIKTDAQIAKDLYSMTNLDVKARDAVLEVIMNSTTSDFVTLRADLRLNADKDFALTETEPVTAKTINNSSIPKGFDTKEIYPKDKKGFYYV